MVELRADVGSRKKIEETASRTDFTAGAEMWRAGCELIIINGIVGIKPRGKMKFCTKLNHESGGTKIIITIFSFFLRGRAEGVKFGSPVINDSNFASTFFARSGQGIFLPLFFFLFIEVGFVFVNWVIKKFTRILAARFSAGAAKEPASLELSQSRCDCDPFYYNFSKHFSCSVRPRRPAIKVDVAIQRECFHCK